MSEYLEYMNSRLALRREDDDGNETTFLRGMGTHDICWSGLPPEAHGVNDSIVTQKHFGR